MRSILISVLVAVLLPIGLGGCLPTGGDDAAKVPETTTPVYTATPGLTPKERNLKAVELLNEGKAEEARVELEASLAELPANRNSLAQNLISQIGVDPVTVLGPDHFTHTVEKGESLSAIAGKYLDDVYKFYILALYNDMNNPSQLQVGQRIKVPGEEPLQTAQRTDGGDPPTPPGDGGDDVVTTKPDGGDPPTPPGDGGDDVVTTGPDDGDTPTPPGEDGDDGVTEQDGPEPDNGTVVVEEKMRLITAANDMSDAGNYPGAIEIVKTAMKQFPDDEKFRILGAGVYEKYGKSLLDEHKYNEALAALESGGALNPNNADLAKRIDDAKKAVRADGLYQDGQSYEKKKEPIEARNSYQKAVALWPDHDEAQIALAKVTPEVAGTYYRLCREAFQRQCLNEALELCDKALEVDPEHEPAKLMRNRASELRDKLGTSSC